MARVNVHGAMRNDEGVSRSIGGQGKPSRLWATLNTDNAKQPNCALRVTAEVVGEHHTGGKPRKTCHQCHRRWVGGRHDGKYYVEEDEGLVACPRCDAPRQGRDTRETVFRVGIPSDMAGCTVQLEVGNPDLNDMLAVGAALCGVKAVQELVQGQRRKARTTIKFVRGMLAEIEAEMKPALDAVMLPGGVSVAHALACVQTVQHIIGGKKPKVEN